MSSEVPEGWSTGSLGGFLLSAQGGGTPPRDNAAFWNGEIPWASVKDMTSRSPRPQESITADGLKNSTSRVVAPGTNILALRMAVGTVARYGIEVAINQDLVALVPEKSLDPDFLFQWLSTHAEQLKSVATGTTVKGLRKDVLLDWPVQLPPLDEQWRIAEVLRSSDAYVAAISDALLSARAAKNAALIEALSDVWPETTVADLLAETRYPMRSGPFGSALLKSELQAEGIPFLGIDNVQVERFVPTYRRFISEEKYLELARYTVFPGDVMVTIMGTVGRCCVVPQGVGTAISSKHVWTITLDRDRYSPALLAWQINHAPWVLDQLRGESQGGIMNAISSGTLRELVVPIPPPPELQQIEELLLSFSEFISATEAELERAQVTKAALAGDLLAGRVRVPA